MPVRYGRHVTGPEPDIGWIDGYQRACVYEAHAGTVIVYALGAWLGEWSGGSPLARLFMADVAAGDAPGALLAQSDEFQPSAAYSDISGGAPYERNVTPFIHYPSRFSLGYVSRNGAVSHSMRQAQFIGAVNRNFYDKARGGTTTPTDPVGGTPAYQGHGSFWFVAEPNSAPATPTALSPAGTLVSASTTPAMAASFADPNETLPNGAAFDHLNGVHLQVRNPATGAMMWDRSYTAGSSERTNRRSSITYAGSTLTQGTPYEWRIRHSDRAGAWSGWSAWTAFTVAPAGSVGTPSAPTGTITTRTPATFAAQWTHALGLSTNAVQVQVSVGGVVVGQSPIITKTVANNGTISISYAESTFGLLQWGTPYTVQIRGRDTNGVWSSWSNPRAFRTNAAPNIPSILAPSGGMVMSARPLVIATATDPDGTNPTVYAEILNGSGGVIATRTMTRNASTGQYTYQTTASDLASYGSFGVRTYSYDGSLYSGEATSAAAATRSATVSFTYAAGPAVTITGPTGTIQTTAPTVTWNVTYSGGASQSMYRVALKSADNTINYYDTLDIASATPSHTIQSQYWLSGEQWNNGETFRLGVSIRDTNGLWSAAPDVVVTLSYPAPATLTGFLATPVRLGHDAVPTAVMCSWDPTAYSAGQFADYELVRVPLSGPQGQPTGPAEPVGTITSPQQTAWLDAEGVSGQVYRYELRQRIYQGYDVLVSAPAVAEAGVDFSGVVLGVVTDPEAYHVDLYYGHEQGPDQSWSWSSGADFAQPLGAALPSAFFGTVSAWNPSGTYVLLTDQVATARARLLALRELAERKATVCWRDGRGERRYVVIDQLDVLYLRMDRYEVVIGGREIARDVEVAA